MKMLKKLLAVVLTGAMALTLFTACGSNAVSDKDIADALNNIVKLNNSEVTFTPQAKEREMARKLAALVESMRPTATVADGGESSDNEFEKKYKEILGCDKGGANADNFVWVQQALADKLGAEGQAFQVMESLTDKGTAYNSSSLGNKEPANDRCMGTALCKIPDQKGNLVTVRIIVVTAKAEG